MEEAIDNPKQVIADVVVDEAERIAGERVREKEAELAKQKEYYEKELIKLQTIIAEAQNSSVVGLIKRKWENR